MFAYHFESSKSFMLIAIFLLILTSCKDDDDTPDNSGGVMTKNYTIDIGGSVITQDGGFIAGALVEFDGKTAITDSRGVFRLADVTAREGVNYVRVSKSGFFDSGRNIHVYDGETVNIRVRLVPRIAVGTFAGATGGVVTTVDGMSAEIPPGAFEGNYQGEVTAFMRYVNPNVFENAEVFPGLETLDQEGNVANLISYGMGQFEFEDENGNLLDLEEGQTAVITVPAATAAGAPPPSIPLWYFDEESGLWVEEGTATLNGNEYIGTVGHFSWWNCDDLPPCNYNLKVNVSCGGAPFPGLPIMAIVNNGLVSGTGVTNQNGSLSLTLPCNGVVEILIIPNGGDEYEQIGKIFTTDPPPDEVIEPIDLEALCGPHATVTGQVVDANMNPVTNGYAYLQYDEFFTQPVFFDGNGEFFAGYYSFDESFWDEVAEIVVWDLDNFSTATGPSVPFNEQLNVLDQPIVIGGDVAATEGRIYMAATDVDGVYCIDASNGELLWSVDEGSMEREVSPVFYDNRLFIRNLSGEFFCFNGFDGSEIWSGFNSEGNSPIIDDQGILYTNALGGTVKAWNYLTGDAIWTESIGANTSSDLTTSGDFLYMGRKGNGAMVALDKSTGELAWEYITNSEVNSSPCIADGRIFFAADNQEIYALDAETGEFLWQATVDDGPYFWGSLTTGQGLVFVQSVNHVRAFDQTTGEEQWEYTILSSSGGEDPYFWNGRLFVSGSTSGEFLCLDANTGQVIWELDPPGAGEIGNYFLVADDVLYMQRYEAPHTLQARNAFTGDVIWTCDISEDLDAPMVLIDDTGQAHYCTVSGMRQ